MPDPGTQPNQTVRAKFLPSKAELDEAISIQAEIAGSPASEAEPVRKPLFGK